MQEFRVFRAIGLAFKSWIRNFIPYTVVMAVLFVPAVAWIYTYDATKASDLTELFNKAWLYPAYGTTALAALLSPMLTYRVIQELSGAKSSMMKSVTFGFRGIIPGVMLGVIGMVLGRVPGGPIINAILVCMWFVAAPAAVAERLNPITSLTRSAELTGGRRWPIFGMLFLIGLVELGIIFIYLAPQISKHDAAVLANVRKTGLVFAGVVGVFEMFKSIVAAVSYALLRGDKDGMTHEQLAAVFE